MTTAAVLTEEYPDECTCNGSEVYFTQKSSRSSFAEITVFANTELKASCALSKLPYSNLAGCLQTRDRVTFKTLTNDLRLCCPRAYDITFDQLQLSTDISSCHGLCDWSNSTSLLHGNWWVFLELYISLCAASALLLSLAELRGRRKSVIHRYFATESALLPQRRILILASRTSVLRRLVDWLVHLKRRATRLTKKKLNLNKLCKSQTQWP